MLEHELDNSAHCAKVSSRSRLFPRRRIGCNFGWNMEEEEEEGEGKNRASDVNRMSALTQSDTTISTK